MMKIEVKLYSYHDMDLVTLYKTGQILFPESTKNILNAYANQQVYRLKMQSVDEEKLARYPNDRYRKYYHYHVILDNQKDAAAISLLKRITPGYRNNFIKSVLRQYICGVFVPEYSIDGNTEFFDMMSRKIQGNREEYDTKRKKHKKTAAINKTPVYETKEKKAEIKEKVKGEPKTTIETRSDIDDLLSAMTEQY